MTSAIVISVFAVSIGFPNQAYAQEKAEPVRAAKIAKLVSSLNQCRNSLGLSADISTNPSPGDQKDASNVQSNFSPIWSELRGADLAELADLTASDSQNKFLRTKGNWFEVRKTSTDGKTLPVLDSEIRWAPTPIEKFAAHTPGLLFEGETYNSVSQQVEKLQEIATWIDKTDEVLSGLSDDQKTRVEDSESLIQVQANSVFGLPKGPTIKAPAQVPLSIEQIFETNSEAMTHLVLLMHKPPPTCRVRLERIQVDNIRQGEFAGVMCIGGHLVYNSKKNQIGYYEKKLETVVVPRNELISRLKTHSNFDLAPGQKWNLAGGSELMEVHLADGVSGSLSFQQIPLSELNKISNDSNIKLGPNRKIVDGVVKKLVIPMSEPQYLVGRTIRAADLEILRIGVGKLIDDYNALAGPSNLQIKNPVFTYKHGMLDPHVRIISSISSGQVIKKNAISDLSASLNQIPCKKRQLQQEVFFDLDCSAENNTCNSCSYDFYSKNAVPSIVPRSEIKALKIGESVLANNGCGSGCWADGAIKPIVVKDGVITSTVCQITGRVKIKASYNFTYFEK